jgi:hypothetical protein
MSGRSSESGNVLFLILVAVVLFAALSYAVTRSTGGSKGVEDDASVIDAAQLVQYPAGIRTAIMRMVIGGADPTSLEFNAPADFSMLSSNVSGVFHPEGGAAGFQDAAPGIMMNGQPGAWYFNAEFEVEYMGLQIPGDFAGNDIVAFLPGIREGVCRRVNREGGAGDIIPNVTTDISASYTAFMDDQYAAPSNEVHLGQAGNGSDVLAGQQQGCFRNNGGDFVYYHVLVER